MRTFYIVAATFLLLTGAKLAAFEATGTIREIDVERGVLRIFANGQDRSVRIARDASVLGPDGQPVADGLRSQELRNGVEVTISLAKGETGPVMSAIRLGRRPSGSPAVEKGKASVGLKPLTDMTAEERYKGEDGGLYGAGRNEPPPAHLAAAGKQSGQIVPLDAEGQPSRAGAIGVISISMSNATQEYAVFKQLADKDPLKSPAVTIVDCAQGGQAMAEWVAPDARAWAEADRRLAQAKVSKKQVQVLWVKLANKSPQGDLADHGRKLQRETMAVLQNAKARFPNFRVPDLDGK